MTRSGVNDGVILNQIHTNGVISNPEVNEVVLMSQQGVEQRCHHCDATSQRWRWLGSYHIRDRTIYRDRRRNGTRNCDSASLSTTRIHSPSSSATTILLPSRLLDCVGVAFRRLLVYSL